MKRGVGAILAAYLLLAVGYNLATPFGAPPDERPHATYVEHLVTQRALPLLRREERDAYEAHQPPLYYLLAAPLRAVTGALPEESRGRTLRLLSTLIGALGLLLIARLAAEVRPGDTPLALGATAFAAFLPMRLATAAAVGNDLLAEAVYTAVLLLLARSIRHGSTLRRTLLLGLILGAGLLTKSTCLLLFPIAVMGLVLTPRPPSPQGKGEKSESDFPLPLRGRGVEGVRSAVIAFAVALLVGGWWLARNYRLYGEVFVAQTFVRYFQDTARPEIFLAQGMSFAEYLFFLVVPLTFRSFWGVFGHMQIHMGALEEHPLLPRSWVYPLLLVPTLLALAGLVRAYLRRAERDEAERRIWAVLVVTALFVVAAFLRFNQEFFQAQGRYLFPAMGPIALLVSLGLLSLAPDRRRPVVAAGLAVAMAALALYALFGTLLPAF